MLQGLLLGEGYKVGRLHVRTLLESARQLLVESGGSDAIHTVGAMNYLSQVIQAQASTLGFKDIFLAIAVVALLAVGPAWMIGRRARRDC